MRLILFPLALLLTASMAGCMEEEPPWWFGASPQEQNLKHLLTPIDSDRIFVEIDVEGSIVPSAKALAGLKEEIGRLTQKTILIVSIDEHPVRPNPTTDRQETWRLHAQWLDSNETTLGASIHNLVHVVYLEGDPPESESGGYYIGHATNRASPAVVWMYSEGFRQTRVGPSSIGVGTEIHPELERAVLVHEFGHVIGLVEYGLEMQTPRLDGTFHSENRGSVMHSAMHSYYPHEDPDDPDAWFVPVWHFDDDDVADVRAYQELHGMP